MAVSNAPFHRIDLEEGRVTVAHDPVATDVAVSVFINDGYLKTLVATPEMTEELIMGHLLGEGIIGSLEDVARVDINGQEARVRLVHDLDLEDLNLEKVRLTLALCSPATTDEPQLMRVRSEARVTPAAIIGMVSELDRRGVMYKQTGGLHSAMLCRTDGAVVSFAEDVGRHNAIDKVIGAGLLRGEGLGDCVLISSGRQPGEIVLKASRSGIPVIASVAAPLSSGIKVAEMTGVTLICFVRGRRMNLYTHHERMLV
ncbi:MAG TPA: formate dehydrogenase accessory sulfurtransferase FdhD [Patescibacteria group bacterium]|nr:formate dehydrogenase accessory sulfurtransferase FdhD [Patescibacteria group bacterium]